MGFLSSPEVAAQYGIPLRTVQAACSSGTLPATKFGRMWMIDPDAADTFAQQWKPTVNGRNGRNGDHGVPLQCVAELLGRAWDAGNHTDLGADHERDLFVDAILASLTNGH